MSVNSEKNSYKVSSENCDRTDKLRIESRGKNNTDFIIQEKSESEQGNALNSNSMKKKLKAMALQLEDLKGLMDIFQAQLREKQ